MPFEAIEHSMWARLVFGLSRPQVEMIGRKGMPYDPRLLINISSGLLSQALCINPFTLLLKLTCSDPKRHYINV